MRRFRWNTCLDIPSPSLALSTTDDDTGGHRTGHESQVSAASMCDSSASGDTIARSVTSGAGSSSIIHLKEELRGIDFQVGLHEYSLFSHGTLKGVTLRTH